MTVKALQMKAPALRDSRVLTMGIAALKTSMGVVTSQTYIALRA